uniref:Uncharacterized protein n=1 Tax=Rhizophora mucronata TaxID=61149 RepID=A0A2P2PD19_RHIMU
MRKKKKKRKKKWPDVRGEQFVDCLSSRTVLRGLLGEINNILRTKTTLSRGRGKREIIHTRL